MLDGVFDYINYAPSEKEPAKNVDFLMAGVNYADGKFDNDVYVTEPNYAPNPGEAGESTLMFRTNPNIYPRGYGLVGRHYYVHERDDMNPEEEEDWFPMTSQDLEMAGVSQLPLGEKDAPSQRIEVFTSRTDEPINEETPKMEIRDRRLYFDFMIPSVIEIWGTDYRTSGNGESYERIVSPLRIGEWVSMQQVGTEGLPLRLLNGEGEVLSEWRYQPYLDYIIEVRLYRDL